MNQPELSVIIPTYNNKEYLRLLLLSLKTHSVVDFTIIVYVDGSTDGTYEMLLELQEQYDNLIVLYNTENLGLTHALNTAVERATTPYLYLINDDMVVGPGWDIILNYAKHDSGIIVSSSLIEPGVFVPVAPEFIHVNLGTSVQNFQMEAFEKAVEKHKSLQLVPGVNQPMLLSKKDYMTVGGWDNRFRKAPFSDIDFYVRLSLLGKEFYRAYDSVVYHFSGKATRLEGESATTTQKYQTAEHNNAKLFFDKWGYLDMHHIKKIPYTPTKGIDFNATI
jgi:O-antigen biosynthesis protein